MMKKLVVMLLVGVMACSLFACGTKKVEEKVDEAVEEDVTLGGFQFYTENDEVKLTDEAKEAFDEAMKTYDGAGFKVIGYLGSQVVSGVNYAFLCDQTTVTKDLITKLSVVTVYKNTDGKCEVSDVKEVDFTKYTPVENDGTTKDEVLLGGWFVDDSFGCGLKEDCKKAFDKAVDGLTGVGYEPIACLGTQVVAGTNYAVLVKSTTVTAEPVTSLSVVTVFSALDGSAQIINIVPFEF